jgi:hypothetical protein
MELYLHFAIHLHEMVLSTRTTLLLSRGQAVLIPRGVPPILRFVLFFTLIAGMVTAKIFFFKG